MELLVAIILLSILILVHELGHFFTARRAGILVEEFGIGLPPRLFGIKRKGTIYSLNALPFGGFVRIHGESGLESAEIDLERAFSTKPIHVRFAVLFSGVTMNFLLGILFLTILFTLGAPAVASPHTEANLTDRHIELIAIAPNSPAEAAGLRIGDRIAGIAADAEILRGDALNVGTFREFVLRHVGKEVTIVVLRNASESVVTAVPRRDPPAGEGALGISMAEIGMVRYPWYRSIVEATRAAFTIAGNTFAALYFVVKNLLTEGKVGPSIAGPVGIVQIAGEAARMGMLRLINFAAILTINLAVLNVLPIPALDGGRILFLGIERVRGKPISRKVERAFHAAGMALLIGLILLITIYDIRRISPLQ